MAPQSFLAYIINYYQEIIIKTVMNSGYGGVWHHEALLFGVHFGSIYVPYRYLIYPVAKPDAGY